MRTLIPRKARKTYAELQLLGIGQQMIYDKRVHAINNITGDVLMTDEEITE